jgi:hypothetical protein
VNTLDIIELDFVKISKLENSIIKIDMSSSSIIGLDECVKITEAVGELTQKKPSLILMIAGNTTNYTSEARYFSASEAGSIYTIADAMIVKNLAQNIMVSFYLKINKPIRPTKAFNYESDAINWLLSLT